MNSNTRLIVNTLAQHIRSLVNIVLSLYSTRLVLQALGQSDFGIFSLVGSVVTMMGFITNAMVVATQRHLSFHNGRGNIEEVKRIFSNSLFLHIIIGVSSALVILLLEPLLFDGVLRIDPTRTNEAIVVYVLMTFNLCITFIATPYKALFIAKENIVYISIIEVVDGVLKLLCAIWLLHWHHDRLIAYAYIMTGIMAFNYFAFSIYAKLHYEESRFIPKWEHLNKHIIYTIFNIAGWTIYMTGCLMGRTNGMAIIFNRFFGTIINTSYGIATQVAGAVRFVALAVTNAMSPQIYKAEGQNNRTRMLSMSEAASKYSYLLMAMAVIPIVFEMDEILHVWLGDVPQYATMLCQYILITALIDQSTTGLTIANLAVGRIRNYSIVINTIKLITVPIVFACLYLGYSIHVSMLFYMAIETVSAMTRLPFLKATAGLSIVHYFKNVFLRLLTPTLTLVVVSWISISMFNFSYRFLFTIAIAVIVSVPVIWYMGLKPSERKTLLEILSVKRLSC